MNCSASVRIGEGPTLYGQVCSPLPGSHSEVEGVALPGPDLPDLVSDTHFHRPVQAVNLGADPQTAFLEGDLDQQPSEAHGQGQTAQMVQGLGVEGEDAVTNHLAQVAALHQVQCPRHHAHVDALGCGAALHVADVALQGHQVPLPGGRQVDLR